MIRDEIGPTYPEAGVIATSPATAPDAAPSTVGFPRLIHSVNIHPSAAAAAPVFVATNALTARPLASSALPALNPNQPNQRSAEPITVIGRLCGCIGWCPKPLRLPIMIAQTSADTPEEMCTTVPPAKSSAPSFLSQPPSPQTQWASGSSTSVAHSTVKSRNAENFLRSANAPVMSAGVMIANIIWNSMNTWCGIVFE